MDFENRLQKAIDRGQKTRQSKRQSQADQAATEEELKALHSAARLELSEHIEDCLKKLVDHFPGFEYATIADEQGWGASIRRDDIEMNRGEAERYFSQIQMIIRPFTSSHLVDLNAKATIRNKELYARNHFQRLSELDLESFKELIDLWILEAAEKYAAQV